MLAEAQRQAGKGAHTSVIGVGVDLVGPSKLSATPGGKYSSVMNGAEFAKSVAAEFAHDVVPVAYAIEVSVGGGWSVRRACGSAELNARLAAPPLISSEFASPLDADGNASGGVILLQLDPPPTGVPPAAGRRRAAAAAPAAAGAAAVA